MVTPLTMWLQKRVHGIVHLWVLYGKWAREVRSELPTS